MVSIATLEITCTLQPIRLSIRTRVRTPLVRIPYTAHGLSVLRMGTAYITYMYDVLQELNKTDLLSGVVINIIANFTFMFDSREYHFKYMKLKQYTERERETQYGLLRNNTL